MGIFKDLVEEVAGEIFFTKISTPIKMEDIKRLLKFL
jgi:hypothetical protein